MEGQETNAHSKFRLTSNVGKPKKIFLMWPFTLDLVRVPNWSLLVALVILANEL